MADMADMGMNFNDFTAHILNVTRMKRLEGLPSCSTEP